MASRYSNYMTTTNASSFGSMLKLDHTSSRPLTKPEKNKTKSSNLASVMKKLVETKSRLGSSSRNRTLHEEKKSYISGDVVAEDLKKNGGSRGGVFGIQKKLFKVLKGKKEGEGGSKALMEKNNVNGNARNLAMVLRSEGELLRANRDQEEQIAELRLLLEEKNIEVEKLQDLCLKQREEIRHLKNSILFPDEKESSELTHAKQLIPCIQRQVTSLTGKLQCLAEDLAKVKADKIYRGKGFCEGNVPSPTLQGYYTDESINPLEFSTTPASPDDLFDNDLNPCLTPYTSTANTKSKVKADRIYRGKGLCEENVPSPTLQGYYTDEAINSLEFRTAPGSLDDIFDKDLNPCLTPYTPKTKSKEFGWCDSTEDDRFSSRYNMLMGDEVDSGSCNQEVSKSSEHCTKVTNGAYKAYRYHECYCTGYNSFW